MGSVRRLPFVHTSIPAAGEAHAMQMPEALAADADHKGSLSKFIVDDYSYCEICATSCTRSCTTCKLAFFCSDECERILQQRGHAAACRFNVRSIHDSLKLDDRRLLSGDGRNGAIMQQISDGKHRGSVAKDAYFALESSFARRPTMSQATTIGFVIVDTPDGGTRTGRVGMMGSTVMDIMNPNSKPSADEKATNGRNIRAFQVLRKLKMLAAEIMRDTYDKRLGTPKHTYVLCTPISIRVFDKNVDNAYKHSWFLQVDTVEMAAGAGMIRNEPPEIAYLGAPSPLAKARVLSLLSAGSVPVSRDDPDETQLDLDLPFHANLPFGRPRVATNRVIKKALGAEVNH